LRMGVEGQEISQKVHTPPAVKGIRFGTWFEPGLPRDPNLIPVSNAPRQPGVLVPVSELVPSVKDPAVRVDPTSGVPGGSIPTRKGLDELFLTAINSTNPGSSGPSTPSSPTTPPQTSPSGANPPSGNNNPPVDPVTGLRAGYENLSFNDAFAQAFKDLGRGKAFAWSGRKYGTCYSGDPKLSQCEALVTADAKAQTGN